jgi:hypothetical protein
LAEVEVIIVAMSVPLHMPEKPRRTRSPSTTRPDIRARDRAKSALLRILGGEVMQALTLLLVVSVVSFTTITPARSQQTNDCKSCRECQQGCLKNHTRDACNNEYNICMKYCRKKWSLGR